jgi:two-component system LytT family response regulator
LDYLTKPVRPERLRQAIERYLHHAGADVSAPGALAMSDSILITIDRAPRFVKVAAIECVLAEGDYTRLVTASGHAGLVLKPLKEWERILPGKHFCRIQRSAIINCEQVLRFEPVLSGGYEVYMRHLDAPLVMSRRYARRFRSRFEI